MTDYYYHAGVWSPKSNAVSCWSSHTRKTYSAAAAEARRMARLEGAGCRPIVEHWDRAWGLRPGNCDAVGGCDFVAEG